MISKYKHTPLEKLDYIENIWLTELRKEVLGEKAAGKFKGQNLEVSWKITIINLYIKTAKKSKWSKNKVQYL